MKTYAAYSLNTKLRMDSSSGAIFSHLAMGVIDKGGVVYGVAMSDDFYAAVFKRVTEKNEIKYLRGSKYLQANVGNTFINVKRDLENGMQVLFSGTICQINGLKSYLQKEYLNLILVDVICHGTSSPKLWRKYIQNKEKKIGKINDLNFRCKNVGWKNFGIKENNKYIPKEIDAYMQMFLRDYSLRPSCYECNAKKKKSSDISLGDFWGIENISKAMDDDRGCSLVIVRTDKGNNLFNEIKNNICSKEVTYKEGVENNPAEYKSPKKPKERETLLSDMNNITFDKLQKKYIKPSLKYFIRTKLRVIKRYALINIMGK